MQMSISYSEELLLINQKKEADDYFERVQLENAAVTNNCDIVENIS